MKLHTETKEEKEALDKINPVKVDSIQDVMRFISKLYISLSVEEERLKRG